MGLKHIKKGEGKALQIIDHVLVEKLNKKDTSESYGLGEIVVPVNAGPPLHSHAPQETFYVIDGNFTFYTMEGEAITKTEVSSGDVVHIPPATIHTFKNTGQTEGKLLGIASPTNLEEFFDSIGTPYEGKKLAAKKPGPWSLLKIGFLAKKYGVKFFNNKLE